LRDADLRNANLRNADLRGIAIDFSVWPMWCGSLDVKIDKRIAVQLAYHLCAVQCDDDEFIKVREMLTPFANQFHRNDVKRIGE